jgi:hypothetical protein
LAELYVDFTQKNGLLLQLISAVIKREVDSTSTPFRLYFNTPTENQMVLFREDCFAIKCINRVLFGDLGKKYLVKLVTPLVKTTLSYSNLIEVYVELMEILMNSGYVRFTQDKPKTVREKRRRDYRNSYQLPASVFQVTTILSNV